MTSVSIEPNPFPVGLAEGISILTAALAAALFGIAIFTPTRSGPFCSIGCLQDPYTNASLYFPSDYFWMIPGILLVPFVLLFGTCLHYRASGGRKVLGSVGVQLAVGYAVVILTTDFSQILAVSPAFRSGHADTVPSLVNTILTASSSQRSA
jgi:hypothetical protein